MNDVLKGEIPTEFKYQDVDHDKFELSDPFQGSNYLEVLNLNNPKNRENYTSDELKEYRQLMENYYLRVDGLLPKFDIKNARDYEENTYLRELYSEYRSGYIPTLDEMKIMVCKLMSHDVGDEDWLPWPNGIRKNEGEPISDGLGSTLGDLDEIIGYEVMGVSRDGSFFEYPDDVEGNTVDSVIINGFIERIGKKDRLGLNQYLAENGTLFFRDQAQKQGSYLLGIIEKTLENDLGKQGRSVIKISRLLYNNELSSSQRQELLGDVLGNLDDLIRVGWRGTDVDMDSLKNRIIGSILVKCGLSNTINGIRDLLKDEELDDEERQYFTSMARSILNLDDDSEVHLDLGSVYRSINFDNYSISAETRKFRVDFLDEWFDKLGLEKSDSILDLGSGTGWLVGDLTRLGYDNVSGFDASEDNLKVAREKYGDKFVKGDWEKLSSYFDKNHKVIMSLGRSLPHTENQRTFINVISQVEKTLDNDGVFIFDMPDPEIDGSEYKKKVQEYKDSLRKFGVEEVDLRNADLIIDSPDGLNFYNRYVPTETKIRRMLSDRQLEVIDLVRENLPGYEKDINMVFVCKKKTQKLA